MLPLPEGARALVFDCDGTLVDSMPLHKRLWAECIAPHGVVLPESYIDTHAGKPTDVIVGLINSEWGLAIDPLLFQKDKEGRYLERIAEVVAIEPVVATARAWRGVLPMAVVSGGILASVEASLRAIGAWDWFDIVLTADDGLPHKPAPDLFLAAAERLGVPPEACHAFEDADAGLAAALAAGMTVTDVRSLAA